MTFFYFFILFCKLFLSITLLPSLSSELPVIESHPSTLDVIMNNPITLPCRATGSPRPTITWQKEGINILTTGNKSYLLYVYACQETDGISYNTIIKPPALCQVEVSQCCLMVVCRSLRLPSRTLEHTYVWLKTLQAPHWARPSSEYKVGHKRKTLHSKTHNTILYSMPGKELVCPNT